MRQFIKQSVSVMLMHAIVLSSLSHAAVPTAPSYTPIQAVPPNVQTTTARPLIMLNMSKDHQLFYRAYNEYSDYNGDGVPDGTYIHTVRYSGYFDHTKCYTYSSTVSRFAPSSAADSTNLCTNAWHGNFLNWATMTRADVVRKVLYGGQRSTDDANLTVLERASLPMDAHSFAKYYVNLTAATAERPNISSLTPFNETEVTFCNTTYGDNATISHTNTNPPLLRAARGNFALWNAHERRQCRWQEETSWSSNGSGNGNVPATTGFPASGNYPSRATNGLAASINSDFVVRVEVCNSSMLGAERCRAYPAGNLKPIGLLQEYGENDQAEFGLLTGSFSRNTSGGVLRKNASSFANEVKHTTNGTFANVDGIVRTLNSMKVYGFRYSDATYAANDNDAAGTPGYSGFCDFQTIGLKNDACASWGNPLGEMFIDTLRYLAGKTSTGGAIADASYSSPADPKGALLGLTVATWDDPLRDRGTAHRDTFGAGQCRPVSTVNFNASVISYDHDGASDFAQLLSAPSLSSAVNQIGDGEGITGTSRFAGSNGTTSNSACTAKTIGSLWSVEGLCPSAPAYKGSFSLSGAAFWANTHPIRTVPTGLSTLESQRAFRVRTYGVALAPGVPRIEVSTSGANPLKAIIQPSYRLNHPTRGLGSGTMVDFRVISQTATSGKYLIVWEDSEQGGDYDSDVTGILEWSVSGNQLRVITSTLADATANPQGFGYTVSGTNADGEHFHSGILNFTYNDATNVPVTRTDGTAHPNVNATGGCAGCARNQPPSRATYTIVGNPAGNLQDPMWYAAKWGGFRDANGVATGTPNATALWDSVNNVSGNAGADGVPDTYFEVFNPDQLERSLRQVFEAAVIGSNAAPAVSSSQLISSGLKYVASFDPKRLNGDIQAFSLNTSGSFNTSPTWSVGTQLTSTAEASRQIITNNQTSGIPFTWPSVSGSGNTAYLNLLKGSLPLSDPQAERLVAFVRGDRSVEGTYGIRTRNPVNIMGPIVNSSPWIQDRPVARFRTSQHPGYAAFAAANASRARLLWVGAGDGMFHAFNATSGAPVMSYVPETLAPRLSSLTSQANIAAFVDGNPFTADVDVAAPLSTPDWRTYAFGTLGRGGRGVFALDATNTATLNAAGTSSNAASIFRWQFTADDDSDLGYVLSDISISPATGQAAPIVKLQDGRFAMVFGNGTGSTNGRAALFILPIQGPTSGNWSGRYYKVVLDSGTGNGLSTPALLDTNNDGMVDTAYAGDAKGNLWKVDLSSATPSSWGSAYNAASVPTPLYIAQAPTTGMLLPITGAPQFSYASFGGVIVTLATGRSVITGDFPRTDRTQRAFGIWDRPAFATGGRALPRGTTTLTSRTATRNAAGEVVLAGGAIDFNNATPSLARDGWYFDMPGSSEMVMTNLEYRASNVIFTSIRPPLTTGCDNVPLGALYLVDPETGLAADSPLGRTTVTVGGVTTTVPIAGLTISDQRLRIVNDATDRTTPPTGSPVVPDSLGRCPAGGKAVAQSDGSQRCEERVCQSGSAALRLVGANEDRSLCFNQADSRIQWREIPGLRTR